MPTVYLTIGPPGAGKTTYISWELVGKRRVSPTGVLSPDALLFVGDRYAWSVGRVGRAWSAVRRDFTQLLATGRDVALDATFVQRRQRAPFVREARRAGYDVVALWFDVPIDVLLRRDREREGVARTVGREVIERMAAALEPPDPDEGFAEIWVVDAEGNASRLPP